MPPAKERRENLTGERMKRSHFLIALSHFKEMDVEEEEAKTTPSAVEVLRADFLFSF